MGAACPAAPFMAGQPRSSLAGRRRGLLAAFCPLPSTTATARHHSRTEEHDDEKRSGKLA